MELLKSHSCRRAGVAELADSVKHLLQLNLNGFVVGRRFSTADDIVVTAFSLLCKFLLVVAGGSQQFLYRAARQ
jgi:hypothetical protein